MLILRFNFSVGASLAPRYSVDPSPQLHPQNEDVSREQEDERRGECRDRCGKDEVTFSQRIGG